MPTHTRLTHSSRGTILSSFQKKTPVLIWLDDDTKLQLKGQNLGYDEHMMNTTLEDAVEIIGGKRTEVGFHYFATRSLCCC